MSKKLLLATVAVATLYGTPANAASDTDLDALRAEIRAMQQAYESKIDQLENKLETLEAKQSQADGQVAAIEPAARPDRGTGNVPATARRQVNDNSFTPEFGVILLGKYQSFSSG